MAQPPPAEPTHERNLLRTLTSCVFLLTILACLYALHWMSELVTPLVVAVFLLILVDGVARQVGRLLPRSPDWMRLAVSFGLMIVLLAAAIVIIAYGAPDFARNLRQLAPHLQQRLPEITERFGLPTTQANTVLASLDLRHYVGRLLVALQQATTGLLLVAIYLGFMIAARRAFERKLRHLFRGPESLGHAERVFERVRAGAESYMGLQTFKAILLSVTFFAVMLTLGLQNALFIAFLVFLGAYIPILGPAAAVILPTALAVLEFDLTWRPVAMFVCLEGLVIGIDNILLPRMQGDRLDVEPVVVLLSLGFWSLIFGMTGALLSTPLTVVVIAIAAETPRLRWLAVALSSRGHVPFESRT